jgi:hypothetical protein
MRAITPQEEKLFTRLRFVVDHRVKQVLKDNYRAQTQEPALTASVAQAIMTELTHHPVVVDGLRLDVWLQNVPDRGANSMERRTGADLYISIVRNDLTAPVSKGILVQSKWDHSLARDKKALRNQSRKMLRRSPDSYVWIYGEDDVFAVQAKRATYPKLPRNFLLGSMSVGDLIATGLRCEVGDPNIGIDLSLPRVDSVNAVLQRLSAPVILNFSLVDESTSRKRSGGG